MEKIQKRNKHSMVQWLQLKKLKFQQTICLRTSHKMGYLNFNAILTELHITFSPWTSQLSVRHGKGVSQVHRKRVSAFTSSCSTRNTKKRLPLLLRWWALATYLKTQLHRWQASTCVSKAAAHASVNRQWLELTPYRRRTCARPEGGS
jgi:hypothetical protein